MTLFKIFKILCILESGGDASAFNEKESARGIIQIRNICRVDICRISHKFYSKEDCHNEKKSFEMFKIYVKYYMKENTVEEAVRIWNGGPKGLYKLSTMNYYEKFNKIKGTKYAKCKRSPSSSNPR